MATGELIDEGASLASKGLIFLAKYTYQHFTTQAQLDLASESLAKSRELLDGCDKNTISQALKVNCDGEEEIGSHLNYLIVERHMLRGELDHLLESKHSLKTVFKARTLRVNAEDLERDTQAFSETIRDKVVDSKIQGCLTHDGHLTDIPSTVSSKEKTSGHLQLSHTDKAKKKHRPAKDKSSAAHDRRASPGQLDVPTVDQVIVNNLINSFTCPFCTTPRTFTSGVDLTVHMNEAHQVRKPDIAPIVQHVQ